MGNRLRPLSAAQAANCENAREPVCKCRCRGALHGAKRTPNGNADDPGFYEQLPETDPHHLPSDAERRELKRLRAQVGALARYVTMCGYAAMSDEDLAERAPALERLRHAQEQLAALELIVLGPYKGGAPPAVTDPGFDFDVWWCGKCQTEWTVPSRPHNPKCPTCGAGGWWRRFTKSPQLPLAIVDSR